MFDFLYKGKTHMNSDSEIVKNIMNPLVTSGRMPSSETFNTRKLMDTGKVGDYFVVDHSGMTPNEIECSKKRIISTVKNHRHKYPGVVIKSKTVNNKTYTVLVNPPSSVVNDKDIVQRIVRSSILPEHGKKLKSGKSITLNVMNMNHSAVRSNFYHWGVKNQIKIGTSIVNDTMTVYPKN